MELYALAASSMWRGLVDPPVARLEPDVFLWQMPGLGPVELLKPELPAAA